MRTARPPIRSGRRRHFPIIIVGAAILGLTALSACGGTSGTTSSPPAGGSSAPLPVTFATSSNPSSIGLLAAVIKAQHLDTKNGVTLDEKTYSPDQAETALLTGQVNTGFFGYVSWAATPAKQSKISLLTPIQAEHGSLLVKADSPYKTLGDLKGRKIASLGPVSANYTDFELLAAKLGFNWKNDFQVISAPPPALVSFLEGGQVDASIVYEPTASRLLAGGKYRSVADGNQAWMQQTGQPLYQLALAANSDWKAGHTKEVKGLTAAVNEAVTILSKDTSVYSQFAGILELQGSALQEAQTRMPKIYTPATAGMAETAVEDQLQLAAKLGIIPSAPKTVFVTS